MSGKEISVTIRMGKKQTALKTVRGRRLKELISDAKITFSFPCGGNGRCGKCVVTFVSGAPKPGAADRNFLTEREIDDGKRVLCRCVLEGDCVIDLLSTAIDEEKIVAEALASDKNIKSGECDNFGIAVDIGTTTVVAALIGRIKGKEETVILDTSP